MGKKFFKFFGALFLVFIISGCDDKSAVETAPSVTSITPIANATSVNINQSISIAFSEAMDESTMTSDNIYLSDGTKKINGTVSYNSGTKTVTFTPTENLDYLTQYTISVANVMDTSGNYLQESSAEIIERVVNSVSSNNTNFFYNTIKDSNNDFYSFDDSNRILYKTSLEDNATTIYLNDEISYINVPYYLNESLTIDQNDNMYIVGNKIAYDNSTTTWYYENAIYKITPTKTVTKLHTVSSSQYQPITNIAIDSSGNIYCLYGSHKVGKITSGGVLDVFAGADDSGFVNGTGTDARFYLLNDIKIDSNDNVFVLDYGNHAVRKITPQAVVSTFAGGTSGDIDGTGTDAKFNHLYQFTIDNEDNLYVSDFINSLGLIKKIDSSGVVTTYVGEGRGDDDPKVGNAKNVNPYCPTGLVTDNNGYLYYWYISRLYKVEDVESNNTNSYIYTSTFTTKEDTPPYVVSISPTTDASSVSNDTFISIEFSVMMDESTINSENITLTSDSSNVTGTVSYNTTTKTATFTPTQDLDYSTQYTLNISNSATNILGTPLTEYSSSFITTKAPKSVLPSVKSITPAYNATNVAIGTNITLELTSTIPSDGLAYLLNNSYLTFTLSNGTSDVASTLEYDSGDIDTIVLNPDADLSYNTKYTISVHVLKDFDGNAFDVEATMSFTTADQDYKVTTLIDSDSGLNSPYGLAVDSSGNIYIADTYNHVIKKSTPTGTVTTFAGSGAEGSTDATGTAASFVRPRGLAFDSSGNLYVADEGNNKIRKITSSGVVSTFAGSGSAGTLDGTGTDTNFYGPFDIAIDSSDNLYVTDYYSDVIRKITSAGVVTTIAGTVGAAQTLDGTGTDAKFDKPTAIAVDSSGNLFVTESSSIANNVRKITSSGVVTTFASGFDQPAGIAVDGNDNIYVADTNNYLIKKITQDGNVTTVAGDGDYNTSTYEASSVDGIGTNASIDTPQAIVISDDYLMYIAEGWKNKIRKMIVPNSAQ